MNISQNSKTKITHKVNEITLCSRVQAGSSLLRPFEGPTIFLKNTINLCKDAFNEQCKSAIKKANKSSRATMLNRYRSIYYVRSTLECAKRIGRRFAHPECAKRIPTMHSKRQVLLLVAKSSTFKNKNISNQTSQKLQKNTRLCLN